MVSSYSCCRRRGVVSIYHSTISSAAAGRVKQSFCSIWHPLCWLVRVDFELVAVSNLYKSCSITWRSTTWSPSKAWSSIMTQYQSSVSFYLLFFQFSFLSSRMILRCLYFFLLCWIGGAVILQIAKAYSCCLTLSINRRVPLVHDQQDKPPTITAWLQAGTAPEGPAWAGVPSLNGKQVRAKAFFS